MVDALIATKPATHQLDPPHWDHEEFTILKPGTITKEPEPSHITVYFDGACKDKKGAGGYVILQDGTPTKLNCHYYDTTAATCNEAEGLTLLRALEQVAATITTTRQEKVNIIGDSKLIISFMNKTYKPGKRTFV